MKCSTDPRVGPLKEAVSKATTHRDEATARLNEANAQRNAIDRTEVETTLRGEQTKYREAVMHSQLHSFSAIVFGKEPTEVTDAEIHMFLRLFVFLPAIGAAFSATIIALTAITRIPPSQVELADDAEGFILSRWPRASSRGRRKNTCARWQRVCRKHQNRRAEPRLKAVNLYNTIQGICIMTSIPMSENNRSLAEAVNKRINADRVMLSARASLWRLGGIGLLFLSIGAAVGLVLFGYSYINDDQALADRMATSFAKALEQTKMPALTGTVEMTPGTVTMPEPGDGRNEKNRQGRGCRRRQGRE